MGGVGRGESGRKKFHVAGEPVGGAVEARSVAGVPRRHNKEGCMQREIRGVVAALVGAAGLLLGACRAQAEVVAAWHFNGLGGTVPAELASDVGQGSADFGAFTSGLGSLTGTDVNALSGHEPGQALAITGSGQNGKGVQFTVRTVGMRQLSLSLAARRSSSGFAQTFVEVWNGDSWIVAGQFSANTTQWQQHQFSLSDFAHAENGTAWLRLRVEGATSGSGNMRVDNLRVEGTAVPAPGGAAAVGMAAALVGRRGARGNRVESKAARPALAESHAAGPSCTGSNAAAAGKFEGEPAQSAGSSSSSGASAPARRSFRRGASARGRAAGSG